MRLFKVSQLLLFVASGMLLLSSCNAQDAEKPAAKSDEKPAAAAAVTPNVATVNGVAIPQARLEMLVKGLATQGQADTPELRQRLREELINREIAIQESVKKGLDKNTEVAAQLEFARQEVLYRAFLQDQLKSNPIKEENVKSEYEKIKERVSKEQEYRTRHVLVDKEEDAREVIAQLKKGARFEKLAREKSKDTGSREKGGDLNWSVPSAFVKPFAEALTQLKKGQYTQTPVQTQFGWHVIRLEDARPVNVPPFDEVKDRLLAGMQQQQIAKAIGELRAKSKVE